MRIDLVLRGDDHLSTTPLQVLLYRALGEPLPSFAHVPMVLGPDGERLELISDPLGEMYGSRVM